MKKLNKFFNLRSSGVLKIGLFLMFISSSVLFMASDAFALSCKQSQGPYSADECWTEVTVSSAEPLIVSAGHLLVWDSDATTPFQGTNQVRLSRASADNAIAAGFAQGNIATGETGRVLVYGFGRVLTVGGIASGDYLYAAASGDVAAISSPVSAASTDPIAVAMQTSGTNGTTRRWAKIKLI